LNQSGEVEILWLRIVKLQDDEVYFSNSFNNDNLPKLLKLAYDDIVGIYEYMEESASEVVKVIIIDENAQVTITDTIGKKVKSFNLELVSCPEESRMEGKIKKLKK